MSKNTPVPDAAVLSRFSTAAAETARGNLEAAKCLLEGRHWGQARSIAVIAFEEAGKAFLSTIAMLAPGEMQQDFPWEDLGWDHKGKLSAAHTMHLVLALLRGDTGVPPSWAEALADLDALARDDNTAKQTGLYTDYVDGHIRSPASVTEEQARAMVAVVEDVLDSIGPVIDMATGLWAGNNVPPWVVSFLQQASDAQQAGADAMEHFVQGKLQAMEALAGMLRDDPEGARNILAVAQHQGLDAVRGSNSPTPTG